MACSASVDPRLSWAARLGELAGALLCASQRGILSGSQPEVEGAARSLLRR